MADFLLLHGPAHGPWTWDGVKGIIDDVLSRRSTVHNPMYAPGTVLAAAFPIMADLKQLTLDRWADDILRQVEAASLARPVVVAHSLAGLLALEVVRRLPTPPTALVLVGAVAPDIFHTVTEMLPTATRVLLQLHRVLPGKRPPGTVRLHREMALKLLTSDVSYPLASQVLGRLSPMPLRPLDALPNPVALEPRCPVTYVVLKRDWFVRPSRQRRMAADLPGTTVVELDAGHEAPTYHPEEVAGVILEAAGLAMDQAA
jgi:pimeloyl-ACP methyl ester carboxylesterase